MKLLVAPTEAEAQALADKAHAHLISTCPGYRAERWDFPRQNQKDGTWGIAVEDRLLSAFTREELRSEAVPARDGKPESTAHAAIAEHSTDWDRTQP